MTDLAAQQQALLALLKRRPVHLSSEYLRKVADSPGLELAREVAVWWRALGIERNCPHTTALLKRLGRFQQAVEDFYCGSAASPYMETMAAQFLESFAGAADPLLRAVAQFELAAICAAQGDTREFTVDWDREPGALLEALREGRPLPEADGAYRITVRGEPQAATCDNMDNSSG